MKKNGSLRRNSHSTSTEDGEDGFVNMVQQISRSSNKAFAEGVIHVTGS